MCDIRQKIQIVHSLHSFGRFSLNYFINFFTTREFSKKHKNYVNPASCKRLHKIILTYMFTLIQKYVIISYTNK